jgi:hypothetical protein
MAWIELTAARLAAKTAELSLVKEVLLADGQDADDILDDELAATVKYVRGYCPTSTALGDGLTIPDELEDAALALVRAKVFTRVEALKRFLTEPRMKEVERAETTLLRWSNGAFKVVPPTTQAAQQASGPSVTYIARDRVASRTHTDGL